MLPLFYLFFTFFNLYLTSASSRISSHGLETTVYRLLDLLLGRAIHGPIPFLGKTFDELSGPLVHTDSRSKQGTKGLRKMRPPTGVFGPFGPEVPPEVPERVSPKSGVCLGVSEGVLQGSFEPRPKMCPKSDLKVSKKTPFRHF